jgi:hypothetical protein
MIAILPQTSDDWITIFLFLWVIFLIGLIFLYPLFLWLRAIFGKGENIHERFYKISYKSSTRTWFMIAFWEYIALLTVGCLIYFAPSSWVNFSDWKNIVALIFFIILPILQGVEIWFKNWLYRDVKRRGMDLNHWTLVAFVKNPIAFISLMINYFIERRKHPIRHKLPKELFSWTRLIVPSIVFIIFVIIFSPILIFMVSYPFVDYRGIDSILDISAIVKVINEQR